MATNIEEAVEDCNGHCLSQSGHGGNVPSEGLQAQRDTDESINSEPILVNGGDEKSLGLSVIEIESSAKTSPAATVDEEAGLPHQRAVPGRWRRFSSRWLTAYRVLASGIVMVNLAVLVFQVCSSSAAEPPLTATAANILAAVLMRQEEVINTSFTLVSKLPLTLPLAVRSTVADLHHYGGVHVGCALSALIWYIVFTALNTTRVLDLAARGAMTAPVYVDITTAYAALLAILLICITAHPRLRARCHNTFEATHRFGGWTAVLVLWLHAGISTLTPDASSPLYTHPSLYLLSVTTLLLILPWLRLRRVRISTSPLSARDLLLTLPFPSMPPTTTLRVSTSPLTEWHAFATIPLPPDHAHLLISRAGDWTTRLALSPPTHLWIRNPPALNFLAFAPLFASLLLVATGAGVGPLLSCLGSGAMRRMRGEGRRVRVLWCVADPGAGHWGFVREAMRGVDEGAVVFDSRKGRPDVAGEAAGLAVREGVEAVMVVSNPKVTGEVVAECKAVGIAAYGAVFDS